MLPEIQNFIKNKKIAVVGVSPNGKKFGNIVFNTLKKRGYETFPVHPTADTIEENKVYNSLTTLPENIKCAVICVQPEASIPVVAEAIKKEMKSLWFQQGADFSAAIEMARNAGIETVSKKCILMYAEPVDGIHTIHRWLAKIFGRL